MVNWLVFKYIWFLLLITLEIHQVDYLHVELFFHMVSESGFCWRISRNGPQWLSQLPLTTDMSEMPMCDKWDHLYPRPQPIHHYKYLQSVSKYLKSLTDIVWRDIVILTKNIVLQCLQYLIKDSSKLQLLLNAQLRIIKNSYDFDENTFTNKLLNPLRKKVIIWIIVKILKPHDETKTADGNHCIYWS